MTLLQARGRKLVPSVRVKVRPPEKRVEPFYQSAAWIALTRHIKQTRWPRLLALRGHCCEDKTCDAVHSPKTRIFFDHVLERRDRPDLALDERNVMGRCGASHTKKTAEARRARYHGVGGVKSL